MFTKMYISLPFVHCILWETIQFKRDFRFPILFWAEMHWPSKANVSSARLSFILKRFSSHLCIRQNGFHVRIKFSMSNLTLELSLCFLNYRPRKSGCLCIPSCRFFFSFSAMNASTFVCDHSLKLSLITNWTGAQKMEYWYLWVCGW